MKRMPLLFLAILPVINIFAQTTVDQDSLAADTLSYIPAFTQPSAWSFIDGVVRNDLIWRSQQDSVREDLERLLEHSIEPYDSTRSKLLKHNFSKIEVHSGDSLLVDSIGLNWLNDSTFLVDPKGWNSTLYYKKEIQLAYPAEDTVFQPSDSILATKGILDSINIVPDTLVIMVLDTAALSALDISLHQVHNKGIDPPLMKGTLGSEPHFSEDRSKLYYYAKESRWKADETSAFHILGSRYQLDSLQFAVESLLAYNLERDSIKLLINDINGRKTPFWLGSRSDDAYRLWIKNFKNDSVTIWLGNPGTREISLVLEDDLNFSRLVKEDFQHLHTFVEEPERKLFTLNMLEPEPIYWDYEFLSAFVLNQTYLSNWTKGGESSFSTMMDLQGKATYNNKDAKTQWINSARLKFGTIQTQEKGFRKNHDALEINSKFNRNAWGKIGMSASFYMKHQLAKGYNYPNDSIPVSRFLNPGTMTLGLGIEYKPFKDMTINLAPLSYKTTFVLDTAHINQTLHGIAEDQRAKREMGMQIVLDSKITPFENMEITNSIRLFSNYLNHPQNVDVDWEVLVNQKINWFFTIRLNLHLIYDDDVRFPVLDANEQAVILSDGSEKKVAKTQFKEFVGLSLQFKF
jgi:Protein of unknown function (DUF3078)